MREDDGWWEECDDDIAANLSSPAKAASFAAWLARSCPLATTHIGAWNSAAEPDTPNSWTFGFLTESYQTWSAKLARAAVHVGLRLLEPARECGPASGPLCGMACSVTLKHS